MKRKLNVLIIGYDASPNELALSFRVNKLAKYINSEDGCVYVLSGGVGPEQDVTYSLVKVEAGRLSQILTKCRTIMPTFNRYSAWMKGAEAEILRLDREVGLDAAIVSTPPHQLQEIGVSVLSRLSIPWIADLRDDWLTNSRMRWITPLHKRYERFSEESMVNASSAIVVNTETVRQRFIERYPDTAEKFRVVPNGFEESDFDTKASPSNSIAVGMMRSNIKAKKMALYTGGIYPGFLDVLLQRLSVQLAESSLVDSWTIGTAGTLKVDRHSGGANTCWRHFGYLESTDMIELVQRSSLLLLFMPPGESVPSGTVPLKSYMYLRSGKPILYYGESGETTKLLDEFPGTFCFPRDQVGKMWTWIGENVDSLENYYHRNGIDKYSCEAAAARFNTIIEQILRV